MEGGGAKTRRYAAVGVIGLVTVALVEGVAGLTLALFLSTATYLALRPRASRQTRQEATRLTRDLPFAADLLAACLKAGQPIPVAVETTARAVGGPLGDRLAWVSGHLRLGANPEQAWSRLLVEAPVAPLARTMIRAASTGSPAARALTRLSDDATHAAHAASSAAARRAGVRVVAPLGLCFLPAFVVLGIVPVVAGLASQVLLP